jgi:hypothetical protein
LHLKSLTLKGFKSFAQPTTFQFERGVTCVVGPNGSEVIDDYETFINDQDKLMWKQYNNWFNNFKPIYG